MPTLVLQHQEPPKIGLGVPNTSLGDLRIPRPESDGVVGWAAQGLWVSAFTAETGILGDFNGNLVLLGPTDAVIVPNLAAEEGFGFSISYRWKRWEAVLQYDKTDHNGTFLGSALSHDTEIENLELLVRRYYWVDTAVQPYLIAGFGMSRADIENGTTDGALTFVTAAEAQLEDGVNFDLGFGVAFYPLPWVSVYGQAMYRFVTYHSSNGLDGNLVNEVSGDNWTVAIGASIRLLPGRHKER